MEQSYFFANESIVFLTKEDARVFFEQEVFDSYEWTVELEDFLNNQYTAIALFSLTEREKEEAMEAFRAEMFEYFLQDDCMKVNIYEY